MISQLYENPQKVGDVIRIQSAAVKSYRGGAAGVVMGTGYATPLNPATAGIAFIGVFLQNNDNSNGVAGTNNTGAPGSGLSSWTNVARRGMFPFKQSGITQASVGQLAYFSTDDVTVVTTPGPIQAGLIVTVDEASGLAWIDIENAVMALPRGNGVQTLAASGAIPPRWPGVYNVTKAGVAALTLAAPTAGVDDGVVITVTSSTANAHTLTATGLLQTGTASVNVATFAAQAGAGVTLMAVNGKWNVISSVGITFS